MKRLALFLITIIIATTLKAQQFSMTVYGGYNLKDKIEFGNVYGYVNPQGYWAISAEGTAPNGAGAEIIFQNSTPHVPLYFYLAPNVKINSDNDKVGLSFLLLNFLGYLKTGNPHVLPYGGIGVGAAFITPQSKYGNSSTKFAWDSKLGVKFKTSSNISVKFQMQLVSISQAAGYSFYIGTGGVGTGATSYSSIYQLGFGGGICYDFGSHKK